MARGKTKNVGLIGLGIIGTRVAATLRKRGLHVFVWNRTPRAEQNFLGSPVEVTELCDIVQIFVSDDKALLETVRQLTPGLGAQHVVTAHSTVAPEAMREAAEIVQRRGARFLEAPFTGSKVAAENGQLVYYIGGDEAALKQARPILELSSKEILHIGEVGDASVIKVATNIVTAATAQIGAEALALVRKAGLSTEIFSQAMKFNASNSATLEMKVPKMAEGDFEPHFSVKHMLKDVRIASRIGLEHGLNLPMTELSSDMLLEEMKHGRGDADYSSVAQRYFPASGSSAPAVSEAPAPLPARVQEKVSSVREKEPEPEKAAAQAPEAIQLPLEKEQETEPHPELPLEPAPEENKEEPVTVAKTTPETAPAEKTEPSKEPAKESAVAEGENLSGGFRSWLSRHLPHRQTREDAGAL